jgi:hypothetical protein
MRNGLLLTLGAHSDPDGHPTRPFPPDLSLDERGFGVIEEGVKELVKVLWELGFRTACSCAGHTHALEPYPWVAMPIGLSKIDNPLDKLSRSVARFNKSLGKDGSMPKALETWVLVPLLMGQELLIYLQPLDVNLDCSKEKLSELRRSAKSMALFLKNECKDIFV